VVTLWDTLMCQTRQYIRLADKIVQIQATCLRIMTRVDDLLNGNPALDPAETQVAAQVDRAHAAFAKLALKLVAALQNHFAAPTGATTYRRARLGYHWGLAF